LILSSTIETTCQLTTDERVSAGQPVWDQAPRRARTLGPPIRPSSPQPGGLV